MSSKGPEDRGSSLLKQPDLGGGQAETGSQRPTGTEPVGAFAAEGGECAPGGAGPWKTAPGEAAAACEDGFPGGDRVRREDLVEAGLFPGGACGEARTGVASDEGEVRGALYEGPERRKDQVEPDRWEAQDRRVRPFEYARHQRV